MKKILVTGAGGTIGIHVIKYLLSEGKYEITALDLKNKKVINKLKKYRKRVNIIFGDVCDRILIEALVKDHDVIIHLASSTPPLADLKKGLADLIDYKGTENIIRAINYYNDKCHLFFASTTNLYKEKENCTVRSKIELDEFDYYNQAKLSAEQLIKEKLNNYTIYRLPLVLGDPIKDNFMYHGIKNQEVSVITKEDAAYAFVKGISKKNVLNKKTFNVVDNETIVYEDLLQRILKISGLSCKYIFNRLFLEKNYFSPTIKDKDELNDLIDYQADTLDIYFNRLRSRSQKRNLNRLLAKPFIRRKEK